MSKESAFLIYCMERYRHFKGLSGADVAKTFDRYDIYGYIAKYFESLHTMGDHCIVQDIDDYISNTAENSRTRRNCFQEEDSNVEQAQESGRDTGK